MCEHKGLSEGRTGAGIGDVRILTPILTTLSANQVNQTHALTLRSTTAMPNRNNSSHICNSKSLSVLLQSCLTLHDLMDYSLPGSSVHGIPQARILGWVAISFSRDLSEPGVEPTSCMSPTLAGGFFTTSATWEANLI